MQSVMRHVPLASTGLEITRMVFGGAPIAGLFAPVSGASARATLEAACACGIRAFDTAPHYGAGLSEQRLGEFLGEKPRHHFVISTKVGRRLVAGSAEAQSEGAEGFTARRGSAGSATTAGTGCWRRWRPA